MREQSTIANREERLTSTNNLQQASSALHVVPPGPILTVIGVQVIPKGVVPGVTVMFALESSLLASGELAYGERLRICREM